MAEQLDGHYCGYQKKNVIYEKDCKDCDIEKDCWGNVEG